MGTTTNYAWPYPELGEAPNAPLDLQELAVDIDGDVKAIDNRLVNLEASHAASISKNVDQSIANNTADVVKSTFQVNDFNYGGMVDLPNSRLIAQVKGLYVLIFNERWASSGEAGSMRVARIRVNGVDVAQASGQNQNSPMGSTTLSVNRIWPLNVGDVVEGFAFQNSGAAVSLTTNFGGTFLSAQLFRRT